MNPHFIVHEPKDSVGVVVVDQIGAGEEVSGWVMETDETISMTATEVVPLGHKLALKDISVGETIFKYGQDIGKAVGDIRQGGHVHVQNVKTKRCNGEGIFKNIYGSPEGKWPGWSPQPRSYSSGG